MQMAFAYVGTLLMPPVFGFIANGISVSLFPVYLLLALAVMVFMHEKMLLKKRDSGENGRLSQSEYSIFFISARIVGKGNPFSFLNRYNR